MPLTADRAALAAALKAADDCLFEQYRAGGHGGRAVNLLPVEVDDRPVVDEVVELPVAHERLFGRESELVTKEIGRDEVLAIAGIADSEKQLGRSRIEPIDRSPLQGIGGGTPGADRRAGGIEFDRVPGPPCPSTG